jgi:hypothetical protein
MSKWLGTLPTTNARIFVTILLILATGIVTLVRWSEPPIEWLAFLGVSAGLDVAQFHSKRVTTFAPTGAKTSEEATT